MDLRLLKFFIATYEEKNITRAANRCFISQPSLSAGLKQLEQELGSQLFIRHKKGVALTEEAHYLYPMARRLINDATRLPELFKERSQHQPLSLGVFPDLSPSRMAQLLASVYQDIDYLALELLDHTQNADATLTLDILKKEDEIFLPLWEEDYLLCCRPDHPLAQQETVKPEQLHEFDFIECPPCEAHQQTVSLLACSGLRLNMVAKAEHKAQVKNLVQAGLGISFLPDGMLENTPDLEIRRIDGPRMFRRIGLAYSASKSLSPILARTIELLSKNKINI